MTCYEHDYVPTHCVKCGGYLGDVCENCGETWDGGDWMASQQELWCHCPMDEAVSDFHLEEDSDLYCMVHECEKHLTDYEDGSRYECPECKREDGEDLGLR